MRHLLYHLYPRHGLIWHRNLSQLAERISLFDGRRICAVAHDNTTEQWDTVQQEAERIFDLVLHFTNTGLGETDTWPVLWEMVKEHQGHEDYTFWAHSKGVTHADNPGITVHRWARLMYEANLDYWPEVERLFKRNLIVGAFKKLGWSFPGSKWHYSGNFFWVRNREFFTRDRALMQVYGGAEAWPGVVYDVLKSGCVFHERSIRVLNLYDLNYMAMVEHEWEQWKRAHEHSRGYAYA